MYSMMTTKHLVNQNSNSGYNPIQTWNNDKWWKVQTSRDSSFRLQYSLFSRQLDGEVILVKYSIYIIYWQ